jgi:hypothetical protein
MPLPELTKEYISETLTPWTKTFTIQEDGSSQTQLSNRGRFGFFTERLFGITPNKEQLADYDGVELKAVSVKNGKAKSISIGTISRDEYYHLRALDNPQFRDCNAYKKMKKTLYVFYTTDKINGIPYYSIDRWYLCDINNLTDTDKLQLCRDFERSMAAIKRYSYENLGRSGYRPSMTGYLDLAYKGKEGYNYPCWKFKTDWMNKMYQLSK